MYLIAQKMNIQQMLIQSPLQTVFENRLTLEVLRYICICFKT